MGVIKNTISATPETIQVRNGLYVEPRWETTVTGDHDAIGAVKIAVVYDDELQRFAVESVTIERTGAGAEITGAMLRDIRVQERVQQSALHRMWISSAGLSYSVRDVLRAMPRVEGRATDEDARRAATIYTIAEVAYMPPLKTIAETLGVSQSTATRLMSRARAAEVDHGDD